MTDYHQSARPLTNATKTLPVSFRMQLLSLDIDEMNQAVTTLSWDTAGWVDHYLTWAPHDFSNILKTYIKGKFIWTPDVALFNIAEEPESKYKEAYASVEHNGAVTWTRTAKHKFPCKLNFAHFPFDTHTCQMNFGSAIYDGEKLDLKLGGLSLSSYTSNTRWVLRNTDAQRIVSHYPCCSEPYITLVFTFTIHRQATYYIYTLIAPTFLLSLFTLVLYLLPYDRPEKITLGITLFGSFFILLIIMQFLVPISDTIPYFVFYLCLNLALLALSTFLNSIIVNMASTDNVREVPKALRNIVAFFARLLCMFAVVRRIQSRNFLTADIGIPPLANNYYTLPLQDKKQQNAEGERDSLCDEEQPESIAYRFGDQRRFESDVSAVRAFTKHYQEKLAEEDEKKRQMSEWIDVARVTNRIFFLLCSIVDLGAIGAYLFLAMWS